MDDTHLDLPEPGQVVGPFVVGDGDVEAEVVGAAPHGVEVHVLAGVVAAHGGRGQRAGHAHRHEAVDEAAAEDWAGWHSIRRRDRELLEVESARNNG